MARAEDEKQIVPALWQVNYNAIMPPTPNKDEKSRLGYFIEWLCQTGRTWLTPDLPAYLHYLLHERTITDLKTGDMRPAPLAPTTANVHLATIRGRYKHLLMSNTIREWLYQQVAHYDTMSERKALWMKLSAHPK